MEEIIHPKGKIYYSVGEVCELFGVNASLLRFWEEEFPVLKIAKNSRGHRIYTTGDVDNLRLIYHLVKEQGMTLDGARKRLRQNRDSIKREAEIVERLQKVRNMLAALREEMGEEVEVIDIEDDVEEEMVAAPKPAATKQEAPKEELADFKMEMPSTKPAPEEPKKTAREKKVGTLIGGDLFSPEDIRLVVAKENSKKNSKEAKKQAIEQTLF
ncbi:MAG: MerR family transcriptional regulator [Tidjanibacter sp.]|nr:MerR family transcriptional regulator [Tidjanibacter sp.]